MGYLNRLEWPLVGADADRSNPFLTSETGSSVRVFYHVLTRAEIVGIVGKSPAVAANRASVSRRGVTLGHITVRLIGDMFTLVRRLGTGPGSQIR